MTLKGRSLSGTRSRAKSKRLARDSSELEKFAPQGRFCRGGRGAEKMLRRAAAAANGL
jgi:hypothetical protein